MFSNILFTSVLKSSRKYKDLGVFSFIFHLFLALYPSELGISILHYVLPVLLYLCLEGLIPGRVMLSPFFPANYGPDWQPLGPDG